MSGAVELFVAPRNGSARRLVIATDGEREVYRDELNPNSASARSKFVAALADRCGDLDPARLDAQLVEKADAADLQAEQAQATASRSGDDDPLAASREALARMPENVRAEADAMLRDSDLLDQVALDLQAVGVAGERNLALALYVCGTSRLLARPLAIIVQGQSSSGKSFTIERTADLFPPEAKVAATSMTSQALHYMPAGSMRHRFVVSGERSRQQDDETAERTRALREMLSAGRLVKLLPAKLTDGSIVTRSVEVEGPIAYVESTTIQRVFEEDANRCLLLTTDERQQQTQTILARLAARYAGSAGGDAPHVVERHHAAQRMLDRFEVVVPFADALAAAFPSTTVEARRAFPLFMGAVQSCALLHQRQRNIDDCGRLVATLEDYHLAKSILAPALARSLGLALSEPARRFFDKLVGAFGDRGEFSARDCRERKLASKNSVKGFLPDLSDAGLIELAAAGRGPLPDRWRLTGAAPESTGCGLPEADDLSELIFLPTLKPLDHLDHKI